MLQAHHSRTGGSKYLASMCVADNCSWICSLLYGGKTRPLSAFQSCHDN